jgi:uncharacterized membrane protein YcfT
METALRLQITCLCLIILAILWLSGDKRKASRMEPDSRLYRALLTGTAFMLAVDSISWYFDGRPGSAARVAVLAANSLYYIGHTIPIALFVLYSDFQIFRDRARFPRLVLPLALIQAFVTALAVLSPSMGSSSASTGRIAMSAAPGSPPSRSRSTASSCTCSATSPIFGRG